MLNLAGTKPETTADGPGLRYSIYVQGCNHRCPGCQNAHTWEQSKGYQRSVDAVAEEFRTQSSPLITGVTYSGGEPFLQAVGLVALTKALKELQPKLNFIIYTGYTWEELIVKIGGLHADPAWITKEQASILDLLLNVDFLVDGRFEKDKPTTKPFRGSANQRFIDVCESWSSGEVVEVQSNFDSIS